MGRWLASLVAPGCLQLWGQQAGALWLSMTRPQGVVQTTRGGTGSGSVVSTHARRGLPPPPRLHFCPLLLLPYCPAFVKYRYHTSPATANHPTWKTPTATQSALPYLIPAGPPCAAPPL